MKTYLTWASVVAAGLAAVLWFVSASSLMNVYVDDQKVARSDRMVFRKGGHQIDLVGTTERQSNWSGYAAVVTGVAALLQALGMALPD
jgi:hypothetical protein